MSDIVELADTSKNNILVYIQGALSGTRAPTIVQLSKPLYSITVSDPDTPLNCLYEHTHFWQLGIGYVRLLEFKHSSEPLKVLTIPRPIADIIEERYGNKDEEYKKVSPWPDVALSVIMRAGYALKGKNPKKAQVVKILKTLIKEVILEDIDTDITGLARDLARANRSIP